MVLARWRVNLHLAHHLVWHIIVAHNVAKPRTHRRRVEAAVLRRRGVKDHGGIYQLRTERGMVGTAEDGETGREGGIGVHL